MKRLNVLISELNKDLSSVRDIKNEDSLDQKYSEGYMDGLKWAIEKIKGVNIYLDLDIEKLKTL